MAIPESDKVKVAWLVLSAVHVMVSVGVIYRISSMRYNGEHVEPSYIISSIVLFSSIPLILYCMYKTDNRVLGKMDTFYYVLSLIAFIYGFTTERPYLLVLTVFWAIMGELSDRLFKITDIESI